MWKTIRVPALVAFCCACGTAPFAPSDAIRPGETSASLTQGIRFDGNTEWIFNPPDLPPGRVGKSNCNPAFPFGPTGGDPRFHPQDASDPLRSSCWEKDADPDHDGWVRQQLQNVHIASAPACGGGPGDIELDTSNPAAQGFGAVIRLCRPGGRGQVTPCNSPTGGGGCGICTPVRVRCH
jgi:hypothetical protein